MDLIKSDFIIGQINVDLLKSYFIIGQINDELIKSDYNYWPLHIVHTLHWLMENKVIL